MSFRTRNTKVLASALISVAIGAVILKILGNNPPASGAFSLSKYYGLDPVKTVISSPLSQVNNRWKQIEINYSSTKAAMAAVAFSSGLQDNIICHFVIYNDRCGNDGEIQSTEKWQRQQPITTDRTRDSDRAIHICVMTDGNPTNLQIKRTEALVEGLSRKFTIQGKTIFYPDNWRVIKAKAKE